MNTKGLARFVFLANSISAEHSLYSLHIADHYFSIDRKVDTTLLPLISILHSSAPGTVSTNTLALATHRFTGRLHTFRFNYWSLGILILQGRIMYGDCGWLKICALFTTSDFIKMLSNYNLSTQYRDDDSDSLKYLVWFGFNIKQKR